MTPATAQFFATHGYVRFPGFYAVKYLAPLRQALKEEWKRLSGVPGLSRSLRTMPAFQQIAKLSSLTQCPGLHQALVTPALLGEVAGLAGRRPAVIQDARLLLSPPRQGDWTLQRLNWHVDVKGALPGSLPGIQAFVLIDDVAQRGGATLALAGSHRMGAAAADLRDALKQGGPDLAARLRDLHTTLVEMAGSAGDVFLMDMRVLHTPSINTTNRPRMMATVRFLFDNAPIG